MTRWVMMCAVVVLVVEYRTNADSGKSIEMNIQVCLSVNQSAYVEIDCRFFNISKTSYRKNLI